MNADRLLAKVTGALIAYGSHAGARSQPVDAAQRIIGMVRGNDMIEIPCGMCRVRHPLTPRESAIVIVTLFGMARDLADEDRDHLTGPDECVREILHTGKDAEGYYEHVASILGDDAIDYPDVTG